MGAPIAIYSFGKIKKINILLRGLERLRELEYC